MPTQVLVAVQSISVQVAIFNSQHPTHQYTYVIVQTEDGVGKPLFVVSFCVHQNLHSVYHNIIVLYNWENWRGIKFGGLVVYLCDCQKLKSANIS